MMSDEMIKLHKEWEGLRAAVVRDSATDDDETTKLCAALDDCESRIVRYRAEDMLDVRLKLQIAARYLEGDMPEYARNFVRSLRLDLAGQIDTLPMARGVISTPARRSIMGTRGEES